MALKYTISLEEQRKRNSPYSQEYLDRKFTEIENKLFDICKTLDEEIIPFIEKLKQQEES